MSIPIARRARVPDGRFAVWAAASASVALFFAVTRPVTHWELDEILFRMGVERFEPLLHHPHPPGYPLLIGLGKLATLLGSDPFHGLVLLAVVSIALSFLAFGAAVERLTGDTWTALAASTLFHLSPALMVHGPTPMSDPPALMFTSLALWSAAAAGPGLWSSAATGVFAAAAIGCRPQYALAILPFLAAVLVRDRRATRAAALLTAFTIVCAAWLLPLVARTGGLGAMIEWQLGQAAWVAQNDAGLARGSHPLAALAFRFVAHPWGSKLTSAPVLLLAAGGAVAAAGRRQWALAPMAALSLAHLASALAVNDPADGVRYALPGHYLIAALAAIGLVRLAGLARSRALVPAALAAFVCASWVYVEPVVSVRRSGPSPPAQAAQWARRELDPSALILVDRSMRPHAQVLFGGFEIAEQVETLEAAAGRQVYQLGEGHDPLTSAAVFSWPDSDAYRKLTRNHYRVVTLSRWTPVLPLRGVGPWESADGGLRWRWLADDAQLAVPAGIGPATIVLGLPGDAPHADTSVSVYADDSLLYEASIARGSTTHIHLDLPSHQCVLRIVSARHFGTPANPGQFGIQMFHFGRARSS